MALPAEEEFFRRARQIGERQAREMQLTGDVAEDCADTFVHKWLFKDLDPPIWTWPDARRDSFLRRSARNHAVNFVRDYRRQWSARMAPDAIACAAAADLPAWVALTTEFWSRIRAALSVLTPRQRTLLVRFHFESVSVAQIAEELNCSTGAVEVGLSAARRRLRHHLDRSGDTEGEMRSFLYALQVTWAVVHYCGGRANAVAQNCSLDCFTDS